MRHESYFNLMKGNLALKTFDSRVHVVRVPPINTNLTDAVEHRKQQSVKLTN